MMKSVPLVPGLSLTGLMYHEEGGDECNDQQ